MERPDRGRRLQRAGPERLSSPGAGRRLRAYAKYLRQANATFSQDYIEGCCVERTRPALVRCSSRGSTGEGGRRGRAKRGHRRGDRGALDERRQPGRGPDPAVLPGPDHGDAAHELLPGNAARADERASLPGLQAGPRPGAGPACTRGRSTRCSSTRPGSRACTCGSPGRPGRPALVGPAGGLPDRDPRPGQGPGGSRTRSSCRPAPRAVSSASSCLTRRRSGGVRRPRAGVLPDVHRARCSTSPTTSRRARSCRPPTWSGTTATIRTWSSPRTRAPRRSPTPPTRSRSRRVLARRRVRLRRLGGLRPQEDGHHRPRRLGVGASSTSAPAASTSTPTTSRWSGSATCPVTSSATACCCRATSGWSRRSTTGTSSSTPIRIRR